MSAGPARVGVAVGLVATCVAPMGLSAWSLTGWARDIGAPPAVALLLPVALDGAQITCASLVAQAASDARSAGRARLTMWLLCAASALANFDHGHALGGRAAGALFAAFPLVAAAMLDLALARRHHAALVALGAVAPPLPRFGVLLWLRFPKQTWEAASIALRDGLTMRAEALDAARAAKDPEPAPAQKPPRAARRRAATKTPAAAAADEELSALPKEEALARAFAATGSDSPAVAIAYLAARGIKVSRGTASKVKAQLAAAGAPQLRVVER